MSVETVLFSRLSGFAGLSTLVGNRVYPNVLPQNVTLPAVMYRRISTTRESAMGSDTSIARARFQLDCFAQSYSQVRAVAEQIRAALQRWRNNSGTVVQDSFILNEEDIYDYKEEISRVAGETHRVSQDFEVIYVEA